MKLQKQPIQNPTANAAEKGKGKSRNMGAAATTASSKGKSLRGNAVVIPTRAERIVERFFLDKMV